MVILCGVRGQLRIARLVVSARSAFLVDWGEVDEVGRDGFGACGFEEGSGEFLAGVFG